MAGPDAVQVADRWHLMENASAAFLNAVRRSMQAIRKAVGVGVVDPASLSAAERRQHSGWLLREAEKRKHSGIGGPGCGDQRDHEANGQIARIGAWCPLRHVSQPYEFA